MHVCVGLLLEHLRCQDSVVRIERREMLRLGSELRDIDGMLQPGMRGRHVLVDGMRRRRPSLHLGRRMLQRSVHGRKMRGAEFVVHDRGKHVHDGLAVLLEAVLERPMPTKFLVLRTNRRCLFEGLRLLLRRLQYPERRDHRYMRGADGRAELLQRKGRRHDLQRLLQLL